VNGIDALTDKIELIIFEFEYLNRDKMESLNKFIDLFGEFRNKIDSTLNIGIEIRNKNYLTEQYFDFLREQKLVHVFSEKQYMPHIYEVYDKYKDLIENKMAIRLLGNDRKEIESKTKEMWNTIADEKTDKENIIDMVIHARHRIENIIINVNNHYEGSAPLTIEKMRNMFRDKGIEA